MRKRWDSERTGKPDGRSLPEAAAATRIALEEMLSAFDRVQATLPEQSMAKRMILGVFEQPAKLARTILESQEQE
jgi:hypothetical protein